MRKQLIVVILLIGTYTSYAQYFAPIGSTWYYSNQEVMGDIDFLSIEAIKDTFFKGRDCVILEKNKGIFGLYGHKNEIVYYEDSIAYLYVPELDNFQILFDLGAKKGDSWQIVFSISEDHNLGIDTLEIMVDSTGLYEINNLFLKKLYVTYRSITEEAIYNKYSSIIVERIGDLQYLVNWHSFVAIYCMGNHSKGLRCYEDPYIGFYETGIADSCTYSYDAPPYLGNKEVIIENNFLLFPNPFGEEMNILSFNNGLYDYRISDQSGLIILESRFHNSTKIDLSFLKPGFYFIQIFSKGKIIQNKKLIKS